jgi:hypothetical protein
VIKHDVFASSPGEVVEVLADSGDIAGWTADPAAESHLAMKIKEVEGSSAASRSSSWGLSSSPTRGRRNSG